MKAIVSGGSGLLGRAVVQHFADQGAEVLGLAYSRPSGQLKKLDLLDTPALQALLDDYKPDVFVHCAAERQPDVVEKNPGAAQKLNVAVPKSIAKLCDERKILLIYISTDYVFDGHAPTTGYDVDAQPNPLNTYGEMKLAGEKAVLAYASSKRVTVLRVPVLYGQVEKNADSAVNILATGAQNTSKQTKMDDYATRYPTCVEDVARVLYDISAKFLATSSVPPILHFSSQVQFTKYKISCLLAKLFGVEGTDHLLPQREAPGPEETPRPRDCYMSNKALEAYGVKGDFVDFEQWWAAYIARGGGRA